MKRNDSQPVMQPHKVGMRTDHNVGSWLNQARARLRGLSENAGLEAQVLLGHVLGQSRAWLLAHPEEAVPPHAGERFACLLERLAAGEPLPYLTGQQEFFGLSFSVSPEVLIPRPETELMVEQALAWLAVHPEHRRAADVGTGSGCIAASLAVHTPDLAVTAVDRSYAALQISRRNAERHRVNLQIRLLQSDLLSAVSGSFDLVCANLPYIPTETLDNLPVARYEPRLALAGGPQGIDFIAALLADAPRWLAADGLLLLEIEARQGACVIELARSALRDAKITLQQDLAGHDRLVCIERSAG